MRILLDTNIIIPFEDDNVLKPSFAEIRRLTTENKHTLCCHPDSKKDIQRDKNSSRKEKTLSRLKSYPQLENPLESPLNLSDTSENDQVDNNILFAVESNAVHALITEDKTIHKKAKRRSINSIYSVQTALDWLRRLHSLKPVSLPNIENLPLHNLDVNDRFFDSLRKNYPDFNTWFKAKAREGRKCWIYRNTENQSTVSPQALCIYAIQEDERVTEKIILKGKSLKLCTFKVGEEVRGRKIGELFLKAAFRYASDNRLQNIFITVIQENEPYLIELLEDFGFSDNGCYLDDELEEHVYVKEHPIEAPDKKGMSALAYHRCFFPHYLTNDKIEKFIIPIRPEFHEMLFPDCKYEWKQRNIFTPNNVGNAIKLAYLCNARIGKIDEGSIILFYRSKDIRAMTSIGVVEKFFESQDAQEIAKIVARRTVYNLDEIRKMAKRPVKGMLFRLVQHIKEPITYERLKLDEVVNGPIQSMRKIKNEAFERLYSSF